VPNLVQIGRYTLAGEKEKKSTANYNITFFCKNGNIINVGLTIGLIQKLTKLPRQPLSASKMRNNDK